LHFEIYILHYYMDSPIYNLSGKKVGKIDLPEGIFNVPWNPALMHQVVTSMQANARTPVAHTKGRGDVRGGGKKPWKQKGTGRARHGSTRSPIWRGGGVTHGPRAEKSYYRAIPKKMRTKALLVALSQKLRDGNILFVDAFPMREPKTAEAKRSILTLSKVSSFEKLATKRKNAALIALSAPNEFVYKSFRNMGSMQCVEVRNLNPLNVLQYTYLIVENPEQSLPVIASKISKSKII